MADFEKVREGAKKENEEPGVMRGRILPNRRPSKAYSHHPTWLIGSCATLLIVQLHTLLLDSMNPDLIL